MDILIPASAGELIDKITILEIKVRNIRDPEKNRNVVKELVMVSDDPPPPRSIENVSCESKAACKFSKKHAPEGFKSCFDTAKS